MPITRDELDERLARADNALVALRRAAIELGQLGQTLLANRGGAEPNDDARSERSDRSPVGDD